MTVDYCDTQEEKAKNPDAKAWIAAAANGDDYAFNFMWDFWCFTHMFDDLVDQDRPVGGEAAGRLLIKFIAQLTFNPFYQKHRDPLFALMVQAVNRWIDGDEWEQSGDPAKIAAAPVIRCSDIEVFAHCAFLTGGWDHMRSVKGIRSYDTSTVAKGV